MLIFLLTLAIASSLAAFAVNQPNNPDPTLYHFSKTDSEMTHVTVGAPDPATPHISPRIFSNFLEHLGGTVYEGLWANIVYNPQFEADGRGRLVRWGLAGNAKWAKNGLAGRSLSLPTGGYAKQLVSLPAHRELKYVGSVWGKCGVDGPALIEVVLRKPDKPAVLTKAVIKVTKQEWSRHPIKLQIPANVLARGESAELVINCIQGNTYVDMVEIFPADHVDGVDPDVLRLSKDLKIELLRWPGGNFVSGYNWKNGIGPREKRPTMQNPAWGGLETHHFGTDEFISFCRRIGSQPQMSINAGNGTPQEAAEWLEYCNGSIDTPMGRLRAKNGHPKPYNVRVWEIGNELYGDWQIGHTDPKGNAERFVKFRDAMLAVDPTIEIISTGKGDEFTGAGLARTNEWNDALLKASRSGNGAMPRYLSLHPLVPLPGDLPKKYSYEDIYWSVMAHPQWWSETYVPSLQRLIQSELGPDSKLQLAPTEWGIIVGGPNWLRYPNHDAESGAVYAALFFHAMFRRGDMVGLSNVTALMHGGGIKRPNSVTYVDPMYYVEKLYAEARPERLIPVKVDGPGYDVPERGFLPAAKAVPYLDVLAGEDRHKSKYLFIINRDMTHSRSAHFTLDKPYSNALLQTLSGKPQQGNSLEKPDNIKPVSTTASINGAKFEHSFPPCSVTIITLK